MLDENGLVLCCASRLAGSGAGVDVQPVTMGWSIHGGIPSFSNVL